MPAPVSTSEESPVIPPTLTDAPVPALSATAEPRGTRAIDRRPRLAQHLATAIVTIVFVGGDLNLVITLLESPIGPLRALYGMVSALALVAIQVLHFGRQTTRLGSTASRVLLAVQAALVYLPVLTFGDAWIGQISFLAGSVLLVLRPRIAWPVFGVIVASVVALMATMLDTGVLDTVYSSLNIPYYGLVVYLLSRLARSVADLHRARDELARRAVAEQRLSFAKDLHDLLGLSLSAIALKGELVHRQIRKSADSARGTLSEITGTAQRALSNVRAVARGYRELTLERESRTAESLLTASDIAVRVHLDQGDLPVQTRTALAKMLREGVTNVLRYSDVERCEIAVRQQGDRVSLDIVNDGVAEGDAAPPESGMATLLEEVRELGGTVTAGNGPDGRFRLHLDLPLASRPEQAHAGELTPRPKSDAWHVRSSLNALFCLLAAQPVVVVASRTHEFWQLALAVGNLAALLVLQLTYFTRPTTKLRSTQSYGVLFVQACLIYLPAIPLQHSWATTPGLVAGCALLVLPPAAGWLVFALNTAAFVSIQVGLGTPPELVVFFGTGAVLSSLVVFGLIWQVRLVAELDSTQRRLAEMAVAEERLRFARDLHDLLGMTLSAIALKSELTSRILSIDEERARVELEEVLGLTRQALADVRSVASGNRELSLESESQSARSVLAAADVHVRLEMIEDDLPAPVRTVLAVVLREGVTNVLRHSNVDSCEIAVRRTGDGVSLDIVNDGVAAAGAGRAAAVGKSPALRQEPSGSGIDNMAHRVANLGGRLTAGVEADGRFRLHAVVPV
jgi:signal transduction histidine kinase